MHNRIHQNHSPLPKNRSYFFLKEQEMNAGDKPSEVNGVPISPSDYVIDFLRCTIEAEDPYMVAVFFHALKLPEIAPCLRTCRVKNKFLDKRLPTHIQTNVLMNLLLLYPSTAEEFAESGMFGEFDESMAGKCLMVCELQITMKDFLQIKRLQHCYYDLTRVKRDDLAAFLLSSGPFIDPNTLKEKVPSVVKELASQEKRLSMASGLVGGVVAGASEAELNILRRQLSDKDAEIAALVAASKKAASTAQGKNEAAAAAGASLEASGKSGYLQKAGTRTFAQAHKRRFFVLSQGGGAGYALQYFESENRAVRLGEIGLRGGFVSPGERPLDIFLFSRNAQRGSGAARIKTFPLRASGAAEAAAWIKEIRRAIELSDAT